jgi:2-hydroxy-3-keto-5-methylthiopentenyl-1-phosphate phosphatase
MKTLVQCDFDGTITEVDASFLILEEFARGDWHQVLKEHRENKISIGEFNARAFAMVKADEQTLLRVIKERVKLRSGFSELVAYCAARDFRLVIVSNGLDFYIRALLSNYRLGKVEWHAAKTIFKDGDIQIQYVGPGGIVLDDAFKEAYINLFLGQGYRVIYAGNGDSDIAPAKRAHHVFARGELLSYYYSKGLDCMPFENFTEVIKDIDRLAAIWKAPHI